MLFEKLIDSEKFAGLGQLAANVTHQLEQSADGDSWLCFAAGRNCGSGRPGTQGSASPFLTEARRMRSTLESLTRISRTQSDQLAAVSVAEMLADMEQLHRSDFLERSIEFRLSVPPSLPRVLVQRPATAPGSAALSAIFHFRGGEPGAAFCSGRAEDDSAGGDQRGPRGADSGGSLGSGIPRTPSAPSILSRLSQAAERRRGWG